MKKRRRKPRDRERGKERDVPQLEHVTAENDDTPPPDTITAAESSAPASPAGASQPEPRARLIRKIELGFAVALTLFVVWLHVTRAMHAGGLWRDEAGAVGVALMPTVRELAEAFQHEAFPLLFPLTVRAYAAVAGSSDAAFRVFGLLVGLSLIAVLWLNARLMNREVPLTTLALLGTNATVIIWGDTIRGYGLGMVVMIVAFTSIWRVAAAPSALAVVGAFVAAVCSVQLLFANAISLLVIGIAGAAVAFRNGHWRRALLILGIGATAAVSLLPYRQSFDGAKSWRDTFQLADFSSSMFADRLSQSLGTSGAGIHYAWLALLVLGVAAAILSQFRLASGARTGRPDVGLYCLIILLLAVPAHFTFLKVLRYPTDHWYYLNLTALVAVTIEAAFLAFSPSGWRTVGRLLVTAAFVSWSFTSVWRAAHLRQTSVDLVADHIEQTAGPEDVVVVNPWYIGVSFGRQYQGSARWMTLPPIADTRIHRYDLIKEQMAAMYPIDPVLKAVEKTLRAGNRVWVVGGIVYLPEGQVPMQLAPAPYDPAGWNESAYRESWEAQLGYLVQHNAINVEPVPLPAGVRVVPGEHAQLIVASGWRTGAR